MYVHVEKPYENLQLNTHGLSLYMHYTKMYIHVYNMQYIAVCTGIHVHVYIVHNLALHDISQETF